MNTVSVYIKEVQSECTDLICTGWKDGNPYDDNDCDDGVEDCDCDEPTATPFTTTSPPREEVCYCELSAVCMALYVFA